MKKIIFFFLIANLTFACKNDPETTAETPAQNSSETTASETTSDAASDQNLKENLPLRMKNVVDWTWWFEAYVSDRKGFGQTQKGKWFKFSPNGSFEFGIYQDLSGAGKWRYDVAKETIFLTYDKDGEQQEWKTMMSNTNDIMIWMAPGTGPLRGDQAKLVRYLQRPEEGQVGK